MRKLNFSFSTLLNNRKFTAVLAFLLAAVIWVVITIAEKPTQQLNITNVAIDINLDNSATSDIGLVVVGSEDFNQKATVQIEGARSVVNSIKSSDLVVVPDISQVTKAGEYTLALKLSNSDGSYDFNLKSISPATITLTFDYSDTKEFKIEPKIVGATAPTGLIVDTPTFSDNTLSTVVVKGPRSAMDKLSSVCAYVEINKQLSSTEVFDAELRLLDAGGNILDKSLYTVSQSNVQITVPICKKVELPVKLKVSDVPNDGEIPISYTLSQTTVTVIGSPENIDALSEVNLAPISLQSVSKQSKSFDVDFALPNGVRVLENIEYITVNFNLTSCTEQTVSVNKNNIMFENLQDGLSATATSDVKNVKLCGLSQQLRSLKDDEIFAVADLSGKSAGEYTVDVFVYSDTADGIWQVGTYTTTVKIK